MRKFTYKQDGEICNLYNKGLSAIKIAKIYDVSTSGIYGILTRNKVKRRSISEANTIYSHNNNKFKNIKINKNNKK